MKAFEVVTLYDRYKNELTDTTLKDCERNYEELQKTWVVVDGKNTSDVLLKSAIKTETVILEHVHAGHIRQDKYAIIYKVDNRWYVPVVDYVNNMR